MDFRISYKRKILSPNIIFCKFPKDVRLFVFQLFVCSLETEDIKFINL